jgi:general secretion pathway protein B
MSLILDALKKSEAERQRQIGPTLLEVRVAKPQRRLPMWAIAVGALLLINMILLLVFVFRPSAPQPAQAQVHAPVTVPAAPVAPPTIPVLPPAGAPFPVAPSDASPTLADDSSDSKTNPADDQPAITKPLAVEKLPRDEGAAYASLPNFSELGGNLPDFRLDLHVYSERPRDRYALVNMQAVHEGDTLKEGARVLAITREGVALDYRGQQFMLRPLQ